MTDHNETSNIAKGEDVKASDAMKAQAAEFDAADAFDKQLRRLFMTPIVDDDYPSVRNAYERALRDLVLAMRANDRFKPGNIYRVIEA